MTCPRCQATSRDGARFCEQCGARQARACPSCGAEVAAEARFCGGCGAALAAGAPGDGPLRRPAVVHSQASRRQDPHHAGPARGRAQARHRALRRRQGLDGAPGRSRSGRSAQDSRPRPRADDGGHPPLRRHGQPGHGRRDHGPLRRAGRPRGPRGARLPRGASHAGDGRLVRGRAAAEPGHRRPDPRRAQLGRGRGPRHRQRPAHGLLRDRPDDAPRRAHGAAGAAGHRAR